MTVTTSWNWAGARWWKFDFHAHTSASYDFQGTCTPREWLLSFMQAEVDCVVITDHNCIDGIEEIRQELKKLTKEKPEGYRDIWVFPGIEITTVTGAHLLAVFPEDMEHTKIIQKFGDLGIEGEKSGAKSSKTGKQILDVVEMMGGIGIPAHIDDAEKTIFCNECKSDKLPVLDHPCVYAVEVKQHTGVIPREVMERDLVVVSGSDSHRLVSDGVQGGAYPGSRYTWVKMHEPSFEGLKLALIDREGSILIDDTDPNMVFHPCIEYIRINQAKYIGKSNEFICSFGPWMNALIGGRGCGKSTVLEFLRLVLDRNNELPKSLASEFVKYSQVAVKRDDTGLLTNDCQMEVIYRKDGARFCICMRADGNSGMFEEADGEWIATNGDIRSRFPVQIYSQKQLFELSRDLRKFLEIVDADPFVHKSEWDNRHAEMVHQYLMNCAKLDELQRIIGQKASYKGAIQDVLRKISLAMHAGQDPIIERYTKIRDQERVFQNWERKMEVLQQIRDFVPRIAETWERGHLDREMFSAESLAEEELLAYVNTIEKEVSQILDQLSEIEERSREVADSMADRKKKLFYFSMAESVKREYREFVERMAAEGVSIHADIGEFQDMAAQFESILQIIEEKEQESADVGSLCAQGLADVYSHRKELTRKRREFLSQVLSKTTDLSMEVVFCGDWESVESDIRNLLNLDENVFASILGNCMEGKYVPGTILGSLYKGGKFQPEMLDELKQGFVCLYRGEIPEKWDNIPYITKFAANVRRLNPEVLNRLRCWFPEDYLKVEFRNRKGQGLVPLQSGSPGQRTAALLSFIFSYGSAPLILDQPEDDLDNTLIYEVIVQQMREMKSRRQVIVVTHDANIVINGYAENVIPLQVEGKKGKGETRISYQGCLHEEEVRDAACTILEGGREAFERRYKRVMG